MDGDCIIIKTIRDAFPFAARLLSPVVGVSCLENWFSSFELGSYFVEHCTERGHEEQDAQEPNRSQDTRGKNYRIVLLRGIFRW